MSNEIELVGDGDGIAFFGDPHEVELFLSTAGAPSREVGLRAPLSSALNAGSSLVQAGSQIAENSGRWVKLTEESSKALKLGEAMKGSTDGVFRAILKDSNGKTEKILEFVKPGSFGTMLTNPAVLAGAAGIMAQLAMQQTMEEITDYLKVIDEKVDDVLRAQKDAALAEMIGVGLVIDESMLKRKLVGRVSEVTWSSLHGAAQTIATTQSYALRRLDALAEKLEKKCRVGELAKLTEDAEKDVKEWLSVLARCFQLQDGLAILELDRVLDSSPEDLDHHREAIRAARARRRDVIASTTQRLLERMDEAASIANTQMLLHPVKAKSVVDSGNEVSSNLASFNGRLGIDMTREVIDAKPWVVAVGDAKDEMIETGAEGVAAVRKFGVNTFEGAKAAGEGLSQRVAGWRSRPQKDMPRTDEDGAQQ